MTRKDVKLVKPLPNLDYRIVCGNSLQSIRVDLFSQPLFHELESLKVRFFGETDNEHKKALKSKIDSLILLLTNQSSLFDVHVYFSEVFSRSEGFDIVIANPPYIKEDENRSAFDGLRGLECYQGKMDIWYLFACCALTTLLRRNGLMSFIATSNWVTNDGASKLRNLIVSRGRIVEFTDFGDFKVFGAGVQTAIFMVQANNLAERYELNYRRLLTPSANERVLTSFLRATPRQHSDDFVSFPFPFVRVSHRDQYFTFYPPAVMSILQKMIDQGDLRLSNNEVFSGIDVMQESVSKRHLEALGGTASVGQGIFVLSGREKSEIEWTDKELGVLKPYYTTREIHRYTSNVANRYWVLYTSSETNKHIEEFPNIKRHLDKYQSIITSVNKPYGLHRTRDESIFLGAKILSVRKCQRPSFTIVRFPCYVSRTFLIVRTDRVDLRYMLAILNSKSVAFFLKYMGKMQGDQFQVDKTPLMSIPIKVDIPSQDELIAMVDCMYKTSSLGDAIAADSHLPSTTQCEREIDRLVFQLYGFSEAEMSLIESQVGHD